MASSAPKNFAFPRSWALALFWACACPAYGTVPDSWAPSRDCEVVERVANRAALEGLVAQVRAAQRHLAALGTKMPQSRRASFAEYDEKHAEALTFEAKYQKLVDELQSLLPIARPEDLHNAAFLRGTKLRRLKIARIAIDQEGKVLAWLDSAFFEPLTEATNPDTTHWEEFYSVGDLDAARSFSRSFIRDDPRYGQPARDGVVLVLEMREYEQEVARSGSQPSSGGGYQFRNDAFRDKPVLVFRAP